jgi:antitoxin VapB
MYTAKIFTNGGSQAVRLPKEYQFSSNEVLVNRVGDVVMLFPPDRGWDIMEESLKHFTPDFMAERDQPSAAEERDPF